MGKRGEIPVTVQTLLVFLVIRIYLGFVALYVCVCVCLSL